MSHKLFKLNNDTNNSKLYCTSNKILHNSRFTNYYDELRVKVHHKPQIETQTYMSVSFELRYIDVHSVNIDYGFVSVKH